MTLYEIREAIRTETDEARITEIIIERDKLVAAEKHEPLSPGEWHEHMLDATFN